MTQISIPTLPVSDQIQAARKKWQYNGQVRPEFADEPGAGEDCVWDFPRPPKLEPVAAVLRVFNGKTAIAETEHGVRVCETAGAPTYYFPPQDVEQSLLEYGEMASICEWKGVAQTINVDGIPAAGWRYIRMFEEFSTLFEWPSFNPKHLLCFIDTELVTHQTGGYYGGWVSKSLAGPIKGAAGTETW